MPWYIRYVIGFVAAFFAVGFLFLSKHHSGEPYAPFPLNVTEWSIIGVFSLLAFLSLWGMVGIGLSKLKERVQEEAMQVAVISRKSWHYRLNTWLNFGKEPSEVRGECEYWSRIFFSASTTPITYVVLAAIVTLILVVGWLFGARPNGLSGYRNNEPGFKPGNQLVGPIVFVLLLGSGLASGLIFSGADQSVAHAPWPTIGVWSGGVTGVVIGGIVAVVILGIPGGRMIWRVVRAAWHAVKQLLIAAGVRIIVGVCRKTEFVDG